MMQVADVISPSRGHTHIRTTPEFSRLKPFSTAAFFVSKYLPPVLSFISTFTDGSSSQPESVFMSLRYASKLYSTFPPPRSFTKPPYTGSAFL